MATSNSKLPNVDPTDIDPVTGYPRLPEGWVWQQFPPAPEFLEDPEWYDTTGKDALEQRQIFSLPTADEQVEQILQLLHDFPDHGLNMIFAAAVKGNAPVIRALLDAGVKAHPEAGANDDMTLVPLHAAAFNGNLECVKVLLKVGGVDVNAVDDLGGTALMRASSGANPSIVKFLLERNADPTIRQNSDVDALEFAAGRGQLETVKMLVDHSIRTAKVNQEIPTEQKPTRGISVTALALAAGADSGNVEVIKFLLEHMGHTFEPKDRNRMGGKLSPQERKAIEGAVKRAALHPHIGVLEILLHLLTDTPPQEQFQDLGLSADLLEAFIDGMFNAVSKDNIEGLEFNWNIVFNLNSDRQTEKPQIVDELLHSATQHSSLSPTKLFLQKGSAGINTYDPNLPNPFSG
ncbi:hypothetical protein B7463_g11248, partial [Scytalidium lignicola]